MHITLLTLSDTRTLATDTSGAWLAQAIGDAGYTLQERTLIKDDIYACRAVVSRWVADVQVQVIITTGGTGVTGRDGTVEAVRPLLDKELEGFGELFRMISYQHIGTSAMQSRALAGLANRTFEFVLPGSLDAVQTAWQKLIAPQLSADTKPCNLAQLVSRL